MSKYGPVYQLEMSFYSWKATDYAQKNQFTLDVKVQHYLVPKLLLLLGSSLLFLFDQVLVIQTLHQS